MIMVVGGASWIKSLNLDVGFAMNKLKGDKSTTKCKVWRKKKFGNGYVTITKVTYSCSVEGEW